MTRPFSLQLLAFLFSLTASTLAQSEPSPPLADARERFRKIRSYACYYGSDQVEALSRRDAAIVELSRQTPANISELRRKGTLSIGYISIGEENELRTGDAKGPGGYDSAYFDQNRDQQPDQNGTWHSWYTNPASESWRKYFLDKARSLRETYGVDGFFLDTVENVALYPDAKPAMVELIRALRSAHPAAIIVLNRGFPVIHETADIVDGLMYESFTLTYDFGSKSYLLMRPSDLDDTRKQMLNLLRPYQEKEGLVVLALDYAATAEDPHIRLAYDRAATLGAIPCVTTIHLDTIFEINYAGVPDPAWLGLAH